MCHSESNNFLKLETLSPGAKTWTDEQSRKNFETVSKLVNPGEPMVSRLLMHPLAPEGGGDVFHSGGRQFMSVNDPDWKAMAPSSMERRSAAVRRRTSVRAGSASPAC